jgi:DNA-binding beta-propeller fold protein YncE
MTRLIISVVLLVAAVTVGFSAAKSKIVLNGAVSPASTIGVPPGAAGGSAQSFVNWESPHVSPLDMTPDGTRLLAVNTADNRLEVFQITESGIQHGGHQASVPVGLDPVSVRARTDTEAWVVNRISGTVSVVDLDAMNVVRTIDVGYSPGDVVFAGKPERAFVTVSEFHEVKVYDPDNLDSPPTVIAIQGREPRMLTTDGDRVYVAIFESGNRTTILRKSTVSESDGPYGGQNPPPNAGDLFDPPIADDLPEPPETSLIVRREGDLWLDDNDADWSEKVTWDLHDHGVAIIDAKSLDVSYVAGTMNINMAIGVNPATNHVTVVGTDPINWVRFEPNINGIFIRVNMAAFDPADTGTPTIFDLNPHLDYESSTIPAEERVQSIGDPRGIVWNAAGTRGYVTGMGSNNIIVIDEQGNRINRIDLGSGSGPTGLFLDAQRDRLFVLNRFAAAVSIIDTTTDEEVGRVAVFDPTPIVIREGRPFLYDTHLTSGLGHTACASCHVDGRSDRIAWDLGDPQGLLLEIDPDDCATHLLPPALQGEPCQPHHHPMKGPMVTQTFFGMLDNGPMHWRGDRENLHAFDVAFTDLQGMDAPPTQAELEAFEAFIGTLRFEANPFRTFFDDFLPAGEVPGSNGNPSAGAGFFDHCCHMIGGGALNRCTRCHSVSGPAPIVLGPGTGGNLVPVAALLGEEQTMKVPHLRELHKKRGFDRSSQMSDRGFGFLHDGSDDTLFSFFDKPGFIIHQNNTTPHFEAFLLSFPTETHPAVGTQVTIDASNASDPAPSALLADMQSVADAGPGSAEGVAAGSGMAVSIVAKGFVNGEHRGYAYLVDGVFQSDRAREAVTLNELHLAAGMPGNVVTFTVVPKGTEVRIGIDRDEDGYFDRDELDAGSDPADPESTPGNPCPWLVGDLNNDCTVDGQDLLILLATWGNCSDCNDCPADLSDDCTVDGADLLLLISNWG